MEAAFETKLTSMLHPEGRAGRESRVGSLRVVPLQHSTKTREADQKNPEWSEKSKIKINTTRETFAFNMGMD